MARNTIVCSKCGEEGPHEAKGLCTKCYKQEHAQNYKRNPIVCSKCGKTTDKYVIDMCKACYAAMRRSEGKTNPEITCKLCGRKKPHAAHGLCASCNTVVHRKANNYKGPMGVCICCGLDESIHAKGMCKSCYNKEYELEHKEERTEYDRERRKQNPEKFREWDRAWREKNREPLREWHRNYYHANIEKMRARKRAWYRADPARKDQARAARLNRLKPGMKLKSIQRITKEARIGIELAKIPELKRVWVSEFLKTAFSERSNTTKLTLVLHINRLIVISPRG